MKQEKVFVRYKNFNEAQPAARDRQAKKPPPDKKKYAQKSNKIREASRQIIDAFQPLAEIPHQVSALASKFSKFFNQKSNAPERDHNQLLNDFVIFNAKKFIESLNFPKKEADLQQSSSDPDWNSDDDIDGNLKSKQIDTALIEKIEEKLADHPIKKQPLLKRHEKQFLEDYFRSKRLQQQEQNQATNVETHTKSEVQSDRRQAAPLINGTLKQSSKENQLIVEQGSNKPKNIWSEYQTKQVDSFVTMGMMTKVYDNDDEMIEAELAEDDGMFFDEEDGQNPKSKEEENSQEDSQGDDGIFGDETPSTTVKASKPASQKKIQSENALAQGMVVINTQIFSKIAESVGLLAARCNWIISSQKQKYKVSTDYMDNVYRKEKICDILPYVSLNHSQFVRNEEVQTHQALQIFRKFNSRKEKKFQHSQGKTSKNQYKQKLHSHHHKK